MSSTAGRKSQDARSLAIISAYSLISQAALGLSYPGTPLYLFHEGWSEGLINAVLASSAVAGLLGQVAWGYLSDRTLTKPAFVEIGCAGNFVGYLLLAGIKDPIAFASVYTATGFVGSASFPVAMALLADFSPKGSRGRSMGVFWSAASVGWASSVAFTGWIVENLGGSYLFLFCALLDLASLLVVLSLGRKKARRVVESDPRRASTRAFPLRRLGGPFFALFLATVAFFVLDYAKNVYVPLYYSYEVGLGATLATLLLSFTSWIEVPATVLFGSLSDRIGRVKVVLASYLLCALFMFTNAAVGGLELAVLAMGIYGLVWGAFSGASSALASELVAEDSRGLAMGLYNSSYSFAAIIAPVLVGSTIQIIGYRLSFLAMGSAMLLFSTAFRFGVRRPPKAGYAASDQET
ncbi:MAG: MFS transporter [Candidatus Brockarchaeota archaeon]|nr:MFS transporter [Candidatus Brockarchaeota archaeon]